MFQILKFLANRAELILKFLANRAELIPSQARVHLHKKIGENLLESAEINPLANLRLGVDQINIYCKEGALTSGECSRFAISNAMGAKVAISASNFEECEILQSVLQRNVNY